jgi:hypothetical protein
MDRKKHTGHYPKKDLTRNTLKSPLPFFLFFLLRPVRGCFYFLRARKWQYPRGSPESAQGSAKETHITSAFGPAVTFF